jgi:hypothetical protein
MRGDLTPTVGPVSLRHHPSGKPPWMQDPFKQGPGIVGLRVEARHRRALTLVSGYHR